ncbi:MAG: hypothetical protein ACRENE_30785 [Polyangiaceae bacterium]
MIGLGAMALMQLAGAGGVVAPCVESATVACDADSGHDYKWFARLVTGAGATPSTPLDDSSDFFAWTGEVGARPLGRVLATGVSFSQGQDVLGLWSVWSVGLFAEIDVTFVLLSGLWAYEPPPRFPFRLDLGSRLGVAYSQSSRPASDVEGGPQYNLIRPETQSYLELAVPLGEARMLSVMLRGAVDTSVNYETAFRWTGLAGVELSWSEVKR